MSASRKRWFPMVYLLASNENLLIHNIHRSQYSVLLLLNMSITFIQIFFNFINSPLLCPWWFHWHLHIDLWVHCEIELVILLDSFCDSEYNIPSGFSGNGLIVCKTCCYAPVLLPFLESIPNIFKITRRNDQYFLICQVDDFCVLINYFRAFININVLIKWFLKCEVILHILIELIGCRKHKSVHKDIVFFILCLFCINFESIRSIRDLCLRVNIQIEDRRQ